MVCILFGNSGLVLNKHQMTRLINSAVVLLIIVILSCAILFMVNSRVNSRIDQLSEIIKNDNQLDKNILKEKIRSLEYQQMSYSDMLSRQSDWFIAYVSILFFIFGFFGYGLFDHYFKKLLVNNTNLIRREYHEHYKKFVEHKNVYLELEYVVNYNLGNFNAILFERLVNEEGYGRGVQYHLEAIYFSYKAYISKKLGEDLRHLKNIIINFITHLESLEPIQVRINNKYLGDDLVNATILKMSKIAELDDIETKALVARAVVRLSDLYNKSK